MKMEIHQSEIKNNGTAVVHVKTSMSAKELEDLVLKIDGDPRLTSWDIEAGGFRFNYDVSLSYHLDDADTDDAKKRHGYAIAMMASIRKFVDDLNALADEAD